MNHHLEADLIMSQNSKKTIEQVRFGARLIGLNLISEEYINAHQRLEVSCDRGHLFHAKWNDIQQGHGCKACFQARITKEKREAQQQSIYAFAQCNQMTVQSIEYKPQPKGKEVCMVSMLGDCGHEWSSRWNDMRSGSRCPQCSANSRGRASAIKTYRNLIVPTITESGYNLLTTEHQYKDNETKLDLVCPAGHEFPMIWNAFQQGRRCPICSRPRGQSHPLWNPDLTDEDRHYQRKTVADDMWRKAVYRRDNWKCRRCGKPPRAENGRLEAHHILNHKSHIELRYDIDNGITFCQKCHLEFHSTYGKVGNNRAQVADFINSHSLPIFSQ